MRFLYNRVKKNMGFLKIKVCLFKFKPFRDTKGSYRRFWKNENSKFECYKYHGKVFQMAFVNEVGIIPIEYNVLV